MKNLSNDELMDKLKKAIDVADKLINGEEKQLVLEIGNNATKLIEYIVKDKSIEVINGFVINTPINSIKNDRLTNFDLLANMLANSIKESKITTKEFVASIASREIITREMNVPPMNTKDLKNFVQLNSNDIFPVKLENYVLGYNILERGSVNKIMIAAIPKDIIEPYIDLGKMLGLNLKGINYSGYELYNFLNFEIGTTATSYLAIDIGSKNTNLVVISNGILKFNKIIPKGYAQTSLWISEELNCNFAKAEQLKRQYNSINIDENLDPSSEEYIAIKYTRRCFDTIISDVNRIMSFYNTNNSKNKISNIYIVGITGRIKGIEDYFAERLNVKVQTLKRLQRVDFKKNAVDLKLRQHNFINCYGAHKLRDTEFNFIKGELKISKLPFILTKKFNKFMVCVGLVGIALILGMYLSINEISENIDNYNNFINSKQEIVKLQREVSNKEAELENLTEKMGLIDNKGKKYFDRLNNIDNALSQMGANAQLTIKNYTIKDTTITLRCDVQIPLGVDENHPDYSMYRNSVPYDFKDYLVENISDADITIGAISANATNVSFSINIVFI